MSILKKRNKTQFANYDHYDNPLAKTKVGGNRKLSVRENETTLTLENKKVRIVFHKKNGSIAEYVNKETKQFLVKGAAEKAAFTVNYVDHEVNDGIFSWRVSKNTDELKELEFVWDICGNTKLVTHARLEKGSDTVSFDIAIENNVPEAYIVSVEYPILNDISALYGDGSRDQFVSPVATGFMFYNPATSLNYEDHRFRGITKQKGLYPAGFEYPMQFMAYITENIGGFYIVTKDGGSTVKSFTFMGIGDKKIRASIHHYLDDTAEVNVQFGYEIQISNLTKGYWQEAGDRYFEFAKEQVWMQKGRAEDRDDINKELYEETVLCNFGIIGGRTEKIGKGRKEIYDLYSKTISGKMFNIYHCLWYQMNKQNVFQTDMESFFPPLIDSDFLQYVKDQGDLVQFFEFNTIFNRKYPGDVTKFPFEDWAMTMANGDRHLFTSSAGWFEYYYMCPTEEKWLEFAYNKDRKLLEEFGLDGLYHDVGTGAATPPQCYNKEHAHGTKCNMIPYFVEQEKQAFELAKEYGVYAVGQELTYEQLLPYVQFYQSRGNGDLLGSMESDDFRELIATSEAVKIPLFDYVYHAYGGLRIDGFIMPYEEMGDGYYYVMAFNILNGGIPEHNFEYYTADKYYDVNMIHMPYLEFAETLGQARTTYGKEFLVYGDMRKAPIVSLETVTYPYVSDRVVDRVQASQGTLTVERVVSSAFEHDGKIAIFFSNIAEEDMTVDFILEAARMYGVDSGEVKLYNTETGTYTKLADIKRGTAKCSLELPSREVVMLVIEK